MGSLVVCCSLTDKTHTHHEATACLRNLTVLCPGVAGSLGGRWTQSQAKVNSGDWKQLGPGESGLGLNPDSALGWRHETWPSPKLKRVALNDPSSNSLSAIRQGYFL